MSATDCVTAGEVASVALTADPVAQDRSPLAPVELGSLALRSTGTRKASVRAAVTALQATGAFETVDDARAALWKLTAADWVEAIATGVRRRDRTAMKLFAQACKLLGQEGELINAFLAQFGLASMEAIRAVLEQAQRSKDSTPEQVDRDCTEWLEQRGFRVLRGADAVTIPVTSAASPTQHKRNATNTSELR